LFSSSTVLAIGCLGSSIMLVIGLYSREQSSPLYTVNTAGEVVEVIYSAAGRVAEVNYSAIVR